MSSKHPKKTNKNQFFSYHFLHSSNLRHNVFLRVHAARRYGPERDRLRRFFDDDRRHDEGRIRDERHLRRHHQHRRQHLRIGPLRSR